MPEVIRLTKGKAVAVVEKDSEAEAHFKAAGYKPEKAKKEKKDE